MLELAPGIQYLHSMDVVHADIKPENVLVHRGQLKICDFGLAGYTGTERHGTATGTGAYMAPELVNRKSTTPYHLREAHDVWSFGIVMYAVLFSDLPWEKARPRDEDFKLFCKKGGVSSKLYPFNTVTSAMRALLRGVLAIKASSRPSMAAVIEHMGEGHAWYPNGKKQPITSYGMREITPADEAAAFAAYNADKVAAAKEMADGASTVSSSDCPSIHDLEISPTAAGTAAYSSKSTSKSKAATNSETPLSRDRSHAKPQSVVNGLTDNFGQLGVA
jgi:serine/threonine protein kinase